MDLFVIKIPEHECKDNVCSSNKVKSIVPLCLASLSDLSFEWMRSGCFLPPLDGYFRHSHDGDPSHFVGLSSHPSLGPPPVWVKQPQDSQFEEGKPGYLHCHAQATPEPEVVWFRNNMMVAPEDTRFRLFSNGTLRINNVEVYDGLMYGCEAKTVGGKLSGQARVIVLEKLKFTPTPPSVQCLELDKEMSVTCSATGRENQPSAGTKADGGDLPSHVEQKNGQLHFTKVTRSDAGNYSCLASNRQQGEIRALVSFTVAVYIRFKVEPDNTTFTRATQPFFTVRLQEIQSPTSTGSSKINPWTSPKHKVRMFSSLLWMATSVTPMMATPPILW
ncbi:hypothetical protein WMY93_014565 [Mugilogobius chulae]|uniref:Ig-like domain-containing protein n=1 Tax=Mugilogobius chulae TaxID=88201 RepID=A0AAW0P4S0_9GOBI